MTGTQAGGGEVSFSGLLERALAGQGLPPLARRAMRLLMPRKADGLYVSAARKGAAGFYPAVLEELGIRYRVNPEGEQRVPRTGGVLAVVNHPFGMLEGIVLADLLARLRPDVRIVANSLLSVLPDAASRFIFVNPFGTPVAARQNTRGVRETIEWLRAGGMAVIFPAGEVAHWDPREGAVTDPEWNPNLARIVRRSGCDVLPIFFEGANSLAFQVLGLLHPRVRTAMLVREALAKAGQELRLHIGQPLPFSRLEALAGGAELVRFLRFCCCRLTPPARPEAIRRFSPPLPVIGPRRKAIGAEVPAERLAREVAGLPPARRLAAAAEYDVWLARRREAPAVVEELGRLREITFRAVGEGTGQARDLDRFDDSYEHLFVWHRERRELVGAYRLARTGDVLPGRGPQGLYTSTLFRYAPEFFEQLGPAVELGRSFVRAEYQKHYQPLLLLWKGITASVAEHPDHPVLFGAVSISNAYTETSRSLLIAYLRGACLDPRLARLVEPRRRFRSRSLRPWEREAMGSFFGSIEELSPAIAGIEADGKGVPVLLRQYLKAGGRILAFNLDARFSQTIDGLIYVDLRRTEPALLDRYMGREQAARFRLWHGLETAPPAARVLAAG